MGESTHEAVDPNDLIHRAADALAEQGWHNRRRVVEVFENPDNPKELIVEARIGYVHEPCDPYDREVLADFHTSPIRMVGDAAHALVTSTALAEFSLVLWGARASAKHLTGEELVALGNDHVHPTIAGIVNSFGVGVRRGG